MRKNKRGTNTWMNWWCRDQNFRKYFEMRKKNGIKPALSGFYHESIYADSQKKFSDLHKLRHDLKNQ
jgi:hypothetical protein